MHTVVSPTDELRQGDIFIDLPWLLFDPMNAGVVSETEDTSGTTNLAETGLSAPRFLLVQAEPASGIVISADCICARGTQRIEVLRVRPITEFEAGYHEKNSANKVEFKLKLQRRIGVFFVAAIG